MSLFSPHLLTRVNHMETIAHRQILPSRCVTPDLWGWVVAGSVSFLKGLGAARMAAMAAVTLALVGFFGFVIMRVTTSPMATLFTDLSYEDSLGDHQGSGTPGYSL
jgi:hypothetical protein